MTTPILGLDEVAGAQAQPHVPINSAVRALEIFGQIIAIDMNQNAPPGSQEEGDVYVLGSNPSGAWAGFQDFSVVYYSGGWLELVPRHGWRVFDLSTEGDFWYDENSSPPWVAFTPGGAVDASAVTYADASSPGASPPATTVEEALDAAFEAIDALEEWILELREVGIPYAQPGSPSASATYHVMIASPLQIPAGLAGTRAYAGTAPTAAATFTLAKNGVQFGTIVFHPSGSIVLSAATLTDFDDGDRLTITAPSGPDATLANVGFTLKAFRQV